MASASARAGPSTKLVLHKILKNRTYRGLTVHKMEALPDLTPRRNRRLGNSCNILPGETRLLPARAPRTVCWFHHNPSGSGKSVQKRFRPRPERNIDVSFCGFVLTRKDPHDGTKTSHRRLYLDRATHSIARRQVRNSASP